MPPEDDQLTSEQAGDPYKTDFKGPDLAMGDDVIEAEETASRFEREAAADMSWFQTSVVPIGQEFAKRWGDAVKFLWPDQGDERTRNAGFTDAEMEPAGEDIWASLRTIVAVGPLLLQHMPPEMAEQASEVLGMATRAVNAREVDQRVATEEVAEDAVSFDWASWTSTSVVADDAAHSESQVNSSGETIPRSARNLNPFNITAAGNYAWTEDGETFGQIGDDGVFARFDSSAHGFRAGFENSSSYDERANREVQQGLELITLPNGVDTMEQWFHVHAPEWKEVNGTRVYENHTKDFYGDFERTAIALGVEWDNLDSRDPQQQLVLAIVIASVEAQQAFPFTKKALLDGMQHAKTRRSGRNEPQFEAVYIEELRDDKNFKIDRVDGRVTVTLFGRTTEITRVGTPRGPNWASAYTNDNPHPVPRVAA